MTDFELRWRALVSGQNREWWAPPARGGLALLSGVYAGIVTGYRAGFDLGLLRSRRLPCPVVAVGNLTVGGTGKTTTVRWLARRLVEYGLRPAVLSYGYRAGEGGSAPVVISGPEGVRQPVGVSGDEPQLLARSLPGVPVIIGRKRVLSGQRAWDEFGVDACLLDDGFQYWRLLKDLEIVLLDATNPFGYGWPLPRGMLREPARALRRAHAVLLTHAAWVDDTVRDRLKGQLARWNPDLVTAEARHVPVGLRDHRSGESLPLESLRDGRWLALSSLGQPAAFERTLDELGAAAPIPARFRDHHPYREADLQPLCARVRAEGLAGVVTTEKDAVKIPSAWMGGTPCRVLEIDLQFLNGQDALENLLRARVGLGPGHVRSAGAALDQAAGVVGHPPAHLGPGGGREGHSAPDAAPAGVWTGRRGVPWDAALPGSGPRQPAPGVRH